MALWRAAVHNAAAKAFNDIWKVAVNFRAVCTEFIADFDGQRYEYITTALEAGAAAYQEDYDDNSIFRRDNVCEITLARALSRTLKVQDVIGKSVKESQPYVVSDARELVKRLGGYVLPALGLPLCKWSNGWEETAPTASALQQEMDIATYGISRLNARNWSAL